MARLSLGYNQLEDIAPLKALTELTQLDISHNKVHDISTIRHMPLLEHLHMANNPIDTIGEVVHLEHLPEDLRNALVAGPQALHHLLNDGAYTTANPLNTVSIMLLGRPGVGKTMLAQQLATVPPEELIDERLTIYNWSESIHGKIIHSQLWDLGHEAMDWGTYRFFMHALRVYVLVVPAGNLEEELAKAIRLFEHGQTHGKARVLVAIQHPTDQFDANATPPLTFESSTIDFSGSYPIHMASGKGMDALKEAILTEWQKATLMHREFPNAMRQVNRQLKSLVDLGHTHIPKAQYVQLCTQNGLTEVAAQNQLLDTLQALGDAFCYAHAPETVVLQPLWLHEGIARLAQGNGALDTPGLFTEQALQEGLDHPTDSEYTGPETLPLIKGLITHYQLGHKTKDGGHYLIYPLLAEGTDIEALEASLLPEEDGAAQALQTLHALLPQTNLWEPATQKAVQQAIATLQEEMEPPFAFEWLYPDGTDWENWTASQKPQLERLVAAYLAFQGLAIAQHKESKSPTAKPVEVAADTVSPKPATTDTNTPPPPTYKDNQHKGAVLENHVV